MRRLLTVTPGFAMHIPAAGCPWGVQTADPAVLSRTIRQSPPATSLGTSIRATCLLAVLVVAAWSASVPASALTLRSQNVLTTGISRPSFATSAPGVADSLFVLEQNSQDIHILDLNTKQITTYLNLPDVGIGGEGGLKGLAFHPNYETNGKFYVHQYDREAQLINILEFTRSAADPLIADPLSQRTILSFEPHPTNVDHTAGWIGFSPTDGYLHIPTGDGGSFVAPGTSHNLSAQNLNDIRGKVLRLDVNTDAFPEDDNRNYAIPESNPFATSGGLPEIYAYGLRSPFRGSFDSQTGDLYIGDVGSVRFEEINLIGHDSGGGQNFGWRAREGDRPNPSYPDDLAPENPTDPLYFYPRGTGAAIIGGQVYRGSAIPELQGHYIFADYVRKTFATFDPYASSIDVVDRSAELRRPSGGYTGVVSFAEGPDGELYFLDFFSGDIWAIVQGVDGDYDLSGTVDLGDYELWKATFASQSDLRADGNRNGVIDIADYTFWRDRLGNTLTPFAGEVASVPEPSAVLSTCLAVVLYVSLRSGRRSNA